MRFEPGTEIVARGLHQDGRIASVESGRVVSDGDRGLLLWIGGGSAVVRRSTVTGESVRAMTLADRLHIPLTHKIATWSGYGALILTPPGFGPRRMVVLR